MAAVAGCIAPMESTGEEVGHSGAATSTGISVFSPGLYEIVPQFATSECLETTGAQTTNMGTADTWNCATSGDPRWNIVQISPGVYELHQAIGGECLTVNGANFANGTSLVLWGCYGQTGSRWAVAPSGSSWTLKPIDNQSYCMDVNAGGSSNGTKMQIWQCNGSGGGYNQQYNVNPAGIGASLSASTSGSTITVTVNVTNGSPNAASNWQVAINLYGAPFVMNSGTPGAEVNMIGGLAVFSPSINYTTSALAAGATTQFSFEVTGSQTPALVTVNGVTNGSSQAGVKSTGTDNIAQAAATTALNVAMAYEDNKLANNGDGNYAQYDSLIWDSHSYVISGSTIVFDSNVPGYAFIPNQAKAELAFGQQDPSVAAYLVDGLQSCFAGTSGAQVFNFRAGVLKGFADTGTATGTLVGVTPPRAHTPPRATTQTTSSTNSRPPRTRARV